MPPKKKPNRNSSSGAKGGASRAAGGGRSGRKPAPPLTVGKPKPWGLIGLTMVVVLFAVGVIGYAVVRVNESSKNTPEARAERVRSMQGVTVVDYPAGEHDDNPIRYDQSPPFGGKHANAWADCTGTVYPDPIRSENAVHSLEHGAIWITYRPDLPADQVDELKKKVEGVSQMLMSPYPGLKSPVSLQSWGFQLFVDSASDERVDDFIDDLRLNAVTTPEFGASCQQPDFKQSPLPQEPTGAAPGPSGSAPASPAPTPTSG
jgi:hypothetical protein